MNYRLGIDVGGTNTDAVLLDPQNQLVGTTKQPTTQDVMGGIENAIDHLLRSSGVNRNQISQAMLGTTHCTNAILERKNLNSVLHLRLGAPATRAIKPLVTLPADLRTMLARQAHIVAGGLDYDGSELAALDLAEIRGILRALPGPVQAVSICGVFSPVSGAQEQSVAELVRAELGADMPLSLSHELGTIGLIERENASVLNAALFQTARATAEAFVGALKRHGVQPQIFFGQNDGTLMTLRHAMSYPILTIASGPTNSIRGASYLADLQDAVVVDVGGTSTDVGVLRAGFPRESALAVEIGGVRTNFRMPDIAAISLGGGTVIHREGAQGFRIGPDSVGFRLSEQALVFGGSTLTLTDIAVAKGLARLGDPARVAQLDHDFVDAVFQSYVAMVETVIDKMKTSAQAIPIILVGGGAILLPERLKGASQIIRPTNFGCANAIGVAIAQISGEVELVASLDHKPLNACMDQAANQAIARAIAAGAKASTVQMVELESMPLAYMPGNAVRIRAKAAGILDPAGVNA